MVTAEYELHGSITFTIGTMGTTAQLYHAAEDCRTLFYTDFQRPGDWAGHIGEEQSGGCFSVNYWT